MSAGAYEFVTFDGFSPLCGEGPYCADDYWRLPEGEPVELIRGRLIVSPCPLPIHQIIIGELFHVLRRAEEQSGGLVLLSPMDVVLDDQNILQPDILFLTKDRLAQVTHHIAGPPSLAVEVLSPSTANRDRQQKLELYAQFAVPEYWIVDPSDRTFDFLINDAGRFVVTTPTDGVYRSIVTPEIEINLADFWAEVDRRTPRRTT